MRRPIIVDARAPLPISFALYNVYDIAISPHSCGHATFNLIFTYVKWNSTFMAFSTDDVQSIRLNLNVSWKFELHVPKSGVKLMSTHPNRHVPGESGLLHTSSWVCVQWHYFLMRNPFRNVIVIHWDDVDESSSGRGGVVTIIKWKTQLTTSQYSPPIAPRGGEQDATVNVEFVEPVMASLCSHTCSIHYVAMSFLHMHNWMGRSEWEREKKKSSKISPSLFGR